MREGMKNPFYGKKHTKESKMKMRLAKLGKPLSEETRIKLSISHKKIVLPHRFKPDQEHFNWKGGKNNYWHIKARNVMETKINRKLNKEEVVHHIDGNPRNNKKENLKLFSTHSEHIKFHWKKQKNLNISGRMKKSRRNEE